MSQINDKVVEIIVEKLNCEASEVTPEANLALENKEIVDRHFFVADGDVHTDTQFAGLIQELLRKKHVFHARIPLRLAYLVCFCSGRISRLRNRPSTLNTDKLRDRKSVV